MPGYSETMLRGLQSMVPLAVGQRRLSDYEQNLMFNQILREQQLGRQYQQMGQTQDYRTRMLMGAAENRARLADALREQTQHNLEQERHARAQEQYIRPGPMFELEDPSGKVRQVFRDSRHNQLYDAVTSEPISAGEESRLKKMQPLPAAERERLQNLGGEIKQAVALARSFKPDYVSSLGPQVGAIEESAGKYPITSWLPGASPEMSNWWMQHENLNEAPQRHERFGAGLTKREANTFESSNSNPGMDPSLVLKNLYTRIGVLRSEAARAGLSAANRFSRAETESALGMPLPKSDAGLGDLSDYQRAGSQLVHPLEEVLGGGQPPSQ